MAFLMEANFHPEFPPEFPPRPGTLVKSSSRIFLAPPRLSLTDSGEVGQLGLCCRQVHIPLMLSDFRCLGLSLFGQRGHSSLRAP
jgi:hypothetical protein